MFSLIMVKCTEYLNAKLQVIPKFQANEDDNYAIEFLRAIKEVAFKSKAHYNIHVSL